MCKILESLLKSIKEGYTILRVKIEEDACYGRAIIESPNGTPQTWFYNKELNCWE